MNPRFEIHSEKRDSHLNPWNQASMVSSHFFPDVISRSGVTVVRGGVSFPQLERAVEGAKRRKERRERDGYDRC